MTARGAADEAGAGIGRPGVAEEAAAPTRAPSSTAKRPRVWRSASRRSILSPGRARGANDSPLLSGDEPREDEAAAPRHPRDDPPTGGRSPARCQGREESGRGGAAQSAGKAAMSPKLANRPREFRYSRTESLNVSVTRIVYSTFESAPK
jgi:hypothetical protein